MSRHRVKDVGYDDDDYYSDDGYASPDPEEQEFLQQCTTAVLQQLGAGQPSITATKEEVQEALWHYYNDIEKSVSYLRGLWCLSICLYRIVYLSQDILLMRSSPCRQESEGGCEIKAEGSDR